MTLLPLANLFGPWELLIIGILGVLLFGKRLPEVGKSLGKGIVEFKKGLAGVEDDITQVDLNAKRPQQLTPPASIDRPSLPNGYKFDPYTGKPIVTEATPEPAKPQMRFDPYTGKPIEEPNQQPANQA